MTNFNKTNIHKLLQNPTRVDLNFQKRLVDAYYDEINVLHSHFTRSSEILRPAFPVTLYYYSDNGSSFEDTASKEIKRFLNDTANIVSVLSGIEKPKIEYGNTPAQNWNASGFDLAQTTRYGLTGVGNVTFLNCAPRLDERGQEDNKTNAGEPVYVGILPNGHVVAANSRYNLVHFRDAVKNEGIEFYEANVQIDGTQFRSRDIFPLFAVLLTNQLTQNLDIWTPQLSPGACRSLLHYTGLVDIHKPLDLDDIPKLEGFTVSHIDAHGNIKLNVRESDLHEKTWIAFQSGNVRKARIGDKILDVEIKRTPKLFDLTDGEAGIYPGSSGASWQAANVDDAFLEIALIGGDAAGQLGLTLEELKDIKIVEFVQTREHIVQKSEKEITHSPSNKFYRDDSEFKPDNQSVITAAYGL